MNRVSVTQADYYKLYKLLEEWGEKLKGKSVHKIATKASRTLGVDLTEHHIRSAAKVVGIAVGVRSGSPRGKSRDKARVNARAIIDLFELLGQTPPADVVAIARGQAPGSDHTKQKVDTPPPGQQPRERIQ